MLLWLNGMTNPQIKHPMETMMEEYQAKPINILPLLIEDEFFIQAKNLNTKVVDFIRVHQQSMTTQLLELVVQHVETITEQNHDHVVVYPILATEFFELDLPPLTAMLMNETTIECLFQGLQKPQDQMYEPQWSNIQRIFALLISKDPQTVCNVIFKKNLLKLFLNHLQSATINSMLIQLFNPEFGDYQNQKLELLQLGFKGFEIMDQMSVLNFTYLIHEIMTRYFSNDHCQQLVQYLISEQIIRQMFICLKKNHDQLFLAKSSAHILSLVSNYYSYTMQNINIYDENVKIEENNETQYHQQLTKEFENSEFMKVFLTEIILLKDSFSQILEDNNQQKLRTLRLKLLEIFDNLTRISNLKLWQSMQQLQIFELIIQIYFKYKYADIYHSIFEKLLLYILNRAISDFHPYWSSIIIEKIDIYSLIADSIQTKQNIPGHIHLLANHLVWFAKELQEKLVIDGASAKYYEQLKKIEDCILLNDKWRRVAPIINYINQKNSIQLGTSEPPSSSNIVTSVSDPVIQEDSTNVVQNAQCLFNKVKGSQSAAISGVSGDEPPEFEASPEKTEEYTYQKQISPEKNNNSETKTIEKEQENLQNLQVSPTPYNIEQKSQNIEEPYKFVEGVYLQPSPNKEQTQIKQQQKKVDMMSVSLQDFVRPIDKVKFSSPETNANKGDNTISPKQKPSVQDIVKKYSNMSKSLNFGQANNKKEQNIGQDEFSFLSMTRKKSMESSLRLKQIGDVAGDEFKILKTNNEETKILTNDNKRILMVDELDNQPEVNSLSNSLVNLSNVSFSSTSSKKRKIIFKKKGDQNNNDSNTIPDEFGQQNPLVISISSSNSLRDSFISTEEKKFRQATKKDKGFLNYIKNIK